jgi:hypothetical protein
MASTSERLITIALHPSAAKQTAIKEMETGKRATAASSNSCNVWRVCNVCTVVVLLALNVAWLIVHKSPTCDQEYAFNGTQDYGGTPEYGGTTEYERRQTDDDYVIDIIRRPQPDALPNKVVMKDMMNFLSTHYRIGLQNAVTLGSMVHRIPPYADQSSVYLRFSKQISNYGLYTPESSNYGKLVDELLESMANSPVDYLGL